MLKQQQTTLERWGSGREPVTQSNLDRRIIDFIVEETLPLQTVDKPSFINLVRIGLPKDLTIICAKTLRDRIEKRACHMRETLANRMGAVAYIATTADCWTNGKKSYFGVTAHWINPTTLKREDFSGRLLVYQPANCLATSLTELVESVSGIVLENPWSVVLGDFNIHTGVDSTGQTQALMASIPDMGLSQLANT
ncbi:uncharacterized protein LOC133386827 [Rhineura floridana]|uniref:uncharacterized protein LOC133386827 n=1 Tax=Rhineura floridana TaxID=261503 RepID=UPI002AC85DC0|nr:uncharacterized protein LOC133386827 [Rhineura floridana]